MDNSNFPRASMETPPPPPGKNRNFKNIIIGVLGACVLGAGGFIVYQQAHTEKVYQQDQTQISQAVAEKSDVQKSFDASLAKLDEMKTVNSGLETKLASKNDEIAKNKAEIRSILNKKNATSAELARAKKLILDLNGKIDNLQKEVARLSKDNQRLNTDLAASNVVRQDLEKKVDVASTLNASNIVITPLKIKNNGDEKETTNARKVDKLKISFDVDNRIAKPGTTDVYVVVIGPDGQPMTAGSSGTFTTREEGDKPFTAKLPVEIETAKRKTVEFAFPNNNFQQGNYTIRIYQNGFKIGEGTRELKKGVLSSIFG